MKRILKILGIAICFSLKLAAISVNANTQSAEELVDQAISQRSFYYYNQAYTSLMQLSDESKKNELLNKLASIGNIVWSDDIKIINKSIDDLVITSSGKVYDDIQVMINKSNLPEVDKSYFLGEVTSWGKKLVWTEDYSKAVSFLNMAWTHKDIESMDKAEKAIENIKNKYSKDYLIGELNNLKSIVKLQPSSEEIDFVKVISKKTNSIVKIEAKDDSGKETVNGNGFIVSENGIVVTSYSVIDGIYSGQVIFEDGSKKTIEGVIGASKEKNIAVLKIKSLKSLDKLNLGDSDSVELGDKVGTIGNVKGVQVISTGIVNGLNSINDVRTGKNIQFKSESTSGYTSGPLFNLHGEVIGVTYSVSTIGGNLDFAIPINEVKPFINSNQIKTLAEIRDLNKPLAPSGIVATAISSNEITIQWNVVDGADYYYLYISDSANGKFDFLKNDDDSKRKLDWHSDYSAKLTKLDSNVTKYFKVTAVRNGIESNSSDVVSATTTLSDTKYYPLLTDVPCPEYFVYDRCDVTEGGTIASYMYAIAKVSNNFVTMYDQLLIKNGWKQYNTETVSGNIVIYYSKNNKIMWLSVSSTYVGVCGSIR